MNKFLFIFGAAILYLQVSQARILNVPGPEYPSIQAGIDSSRAGDTVLVVAGIYLENINFKGKNIVVGSEFLLDRDVSHITATIIDGSQPAQPDSASCVRIVSGEDSTAALIGFTLTGGRGTVWRDIHNFQLYREGGGIIIELSSPTIKFNLIYNNDASDRSGCRSAGGGGIRAGDGNPLIENNVIMLNQGRYGGGIVLNYATGRIRNNAIVRNGGGQDYGGGGIWSYAGGPAVIDNNIILENSSVRGGGGMLVWSTSVVGKGNVIWGNSGMDSASSQIGLNSGLADLTHNNILYGWEGEGNINLEPSFSDQEYHLGQGSPCIDSGPPEEAYFDPEDPGAPGQAAWPSVGTRRNDLGVYGGPHREVLPPFGNLLPVEWEVPPQNFELEQNFPNPFNSSTVFSFDLDNEKRVTLSIYDILGREIDRVMESQLKAGRHVVTWQAGNNCSGVYFYKLSLDRENRFGRMTLLK